MLFAHILFFILLFLLLTFCGSDQPSTNISALEVTDPFLNSAVDDLFEQLSQRLISKNDGFMRMRNISSGIFFTDAELDAFFKHLRTEIAAQAMGANSSKIEILSTAFFKTLNIQLRKTLLNEELFSLTSDYLQEFLKKAVSYQSTYFTDQTPGSISSAHFIYVFAGLKTLSIDLTKLTDSEKKELTLMFSNALGMACASTTWTTAEKAKLEGDLMSSVLTTLSAAEQEQIKPLIAAGIDLDSAAKDTCFPKKG